MKKQKRSHKNGCSYRGVNLNKSIKFLSSINLSIYFLLFSPLCLSAEEMNVEIFFNKYPLPIYQDIIIQNEIYSKGTDFCAPRHEMIKPILEQCNNHFKLLDLG